MLEFWNHIILDYILNCGYLNLTFYINETRRRFLSREIKLEFLLVKDSIAYGNLSLYGWSISLSFSSYVRSSINNLE